MRALIRLVLPILLAVLHPASATTPPSGVCEAAIATAEGEARVPDQFLSAIAKVESGRADPASGGLIAWPWTVTANGQGSFYDTKEQAVEAVRTLQKSGTRSIDVGCLQVNLMHHPEAFASLEQAFDPAMNARFAASFLVSLFGQTGSWPHAAAAYHSQTPTIGADYQRKVLAAWALPRQPQAPGAKRSQVAQDTVAQDTVAQDTVAQDRGAPGSAASLPPGSSGQQAWGGPAVTGFLPATQVTSRPSTLAGRDLAAYRVVPVPLAWRSAAQSRRHTG